MFFSLHVCSMGIMESSKVVSETYGERRDVWPVPGIRNSPSWAGVARV